MRINYLTTNEFKFSIAKRYFDSIEGHELVQHSLDIPEMQDDSCENIAAKAAVAAAKELGEPCVKLDVGYSINALGGFPGPFVKYVNQWLTEKDILAMLANASDRSACFIDATAIGFPDGTSRVFVKKYTGKIAQSEEYIPSSWPVNSLFIPDGYDQPLGSMSDEQQQQYWGEGTWPMVIDYLKSL